VIEISIRGMVWWIRHSLDEAGAKVLFKFIILSFVG